MPTTPPGVAANAFSSVANSANVLSNTSTEKPAALEERGEVEQAERRIRLHDLPLLLVLGEEVAVREQDVGHCDSAESQRSRQRRGRWQSPVGVAELFFAFDEIVPALPRVPVFPDASPASCSRLRTAR